MRAIPIVVLLTLSAGGLAAQEAGVASATARSVQLRQLEWQRTTLVAMADSMPEAQYRDRAAAAQRDFAQQIHHAASTILFICARYFGQTPPALPDTAVVFNSRAGLTEYVNAVYGFAAQTLEQQADTDRAEVVNMFGMMEIPRWQVWDQIYLHTAWTAGQVVANFRKHGMAPPGFVFF